MGDVLHSIPVTCDLCVDRERAKDPLPHFATEDKHPGWHSRKHRTRDAQDNARATYKATRGPESRRRRAGQEPSDG